MLCKLCCNPPPANPVSACAGSIVPGSTFSGEYGDPLSMQSLSGLASNQPMLPNGAFNPLVPPAESGPYPRPPSYGQQNLPLQPGGNLPSMPDVSPRRLHAFLFIPKTIDGRDCALAAHSVARFLSVPEARQVLNSLALAVHHRQEGPARLG